MDSRETERSGTKLCRSCGNEILEIAKVCTSCGRHQSAIREAILVWAPIAFSLVALVTALGSPLLRNMTLQKDIDGLVVSLRESVKEYEGVTARLEKGSGDVSDCNGGRPTSLVIDYDGKEVEYKITPESHRKCVEKHWPSWAEDYIQGYLLLSNIWHARTELSTLMNSLGESVSASVVADVAARACHELRDSLLNSERARVKQLEFAKSLEADFLREIPRPPMPEFCFTVLFPPLKHDGDPATQ